MAELKEKLFSEFAPVSTEEWMRKSLFGRQAKDLM